VCVFVVGDTLIFGAHWVLDDLAATIGDEIVALLAGKNSEV
jgi:hypothetical protein